MLLLRLEKTNLKLPSDAPADLVDLIFSPEMGRLQAVANQNVGDSSADHFDNGNLPNFFCMSCFHKAYTTWKEQQHTTESGPRLKRDLNGQILDESLNELANEEELETEENLLLVNAALVVHAHLQVR